MVLVKLNDVCFEFCKLAGDIFHERRKYDHPLQACQDLINQIFTLQYFDTEKETLLDLTNFMKNEANAGDWIKAAFSETTGGNEECK